MAYQEYYLLSGKREWKLKKPGILQPFRTFKNEKEALEFVHSLFRTPEVSIRVQDSTGRWKNLEPKTED
ncbi:MAG: hypothetical protein GW949_00330 [Spirochaetales bacterium]|nr:hypothetical protein [Spirochaetales bacterium]